MRKQVLLSWHFISAAFQNKPIFWWTREGISFRVVLTWYFITRNDISFLSKWPQWNNAHNEFQMHMRIEHNTQRVCTYSFRFENVKLKDWEKIQNILVLLNNASRSDILQNIVPYIISARTVGTYLLRFPWSNQHD